MPRKKYSNKKASPVTTLMAVVIAAIVGTWSYCQGKPNNDTPAAVNTEQTTAQNTSQQSSDVYSGDTSVAEKTANVDDSESSESSAASPVCGLPQVSKGTPEVILHRFAYTCSFNPDTKIPNWVAWELTADHTSGPYKRNGIPFQEDEGVTTQDYVRSGYDRGHMCPSGDNKWNETAQEQSFLMTNMCPQNHNLNAGDWNEIEMQCRRWAEKFGKIDIISGPILFRGNHKRIGSGVTVPEAFYKVVYCPSRQMAIGFIYRNEAGNRPKGDYVNTVAQIERITGFKFLTALPEATAKKVKNEADLDEWY